MNLADILKLAGLTQQEPMNSLSTPGSSCNQHMNPDDMRTLVIKLERPQPEQEQEIVATEEVEDSYANVPDEREVGNTHDDFSFKGFGKRKRHTHDALGNYGDNPLEESKMFIEYSNYKKTSKDFKLLEYSNKVADKIANTDFRKWLTQWQNASRLGDLAGKNQIMTNAKRAGIDLSPALVQKSGLFGGTQSTGVKPMFLNAMRDANKSGKTKETVGKFNTDSSGNVASKSMPTSTSFTAMGDPGTERPDDIEHQANVAAAKDSGMATDDLSQISTLASAPEQVARAKPQIKHASEFVGSMPKATQVARAKPQIKHASEFVGSMPKATKKSAVDPNYTYGKTFDMTKHDDDLGATQISKADAHNRLYKKHGPNIAKRLAGVSTGF